MSWDGKKILLHSNAPWATTGYGQQTAMFGPRFAELGYDVAFSANFGLEGGIQPWIDMRTGRVFDVYPNDGAWGNKYMPFAAGLHAGDKSDVDAIKSVLCLTLMDMWVLGNAAFGEMQVASWIPIDHDPVPPRVRAGLATVKPVPIAMSRFGEDKLREIGEDPLYVPHGVDTVALQPASKVEARERLGVDPDVFLVGMVAANQGTHPPRKAFPQALRAFAELHHQHPDTRLYLHTFQKTDQGLHLPLLLPELGVPTEAVYWTDQIDLAFGLVGNMADVYNAMDVLLMPSYGEGFGIPAVEAQACGIPVIVNNFSAQPELRFEGWLTDGAPFFDVTQNAWFNQPSVVSIYECLDEAYRTAESLRGKSREAALAYDADRVLEEHWKPAFSALKKRLAEREPEPMPEVNLNRKQRRGATRA